MLDITRADNTILSRVKQLLQENSLPTNDINNQTAFFVAKDQEEIVGTIGIEFYQQYALLRSLVVVSEKRSQSIGIMLIAFIEEYARKKGAIELFLLTTPAENFFAEKNIKSLNELLYQMK